MKRFLSTFLCFLATMAFALAQDRLTLEDVTNIRFAAAQTLGGLPQLLNNISNGQLEDGTRLEDIVQSYRAGHRFQIFFDKTIVIQNDLDTSATNGEDVSIERYLESFDTGYPKSDDNTIKIDGVTLSNVKKNDAFGYYILIKYESKFDRPGYKVKTREALLRLDRSSLKWKALIANLYFYDQAKPITSDQNDIPIYRDTSAASTTLTPEELRQRVDSTETVANAAQKLIDDQFKQLLTAGNNALTDRHYDDAIDYFDRALDKKPDDLSLENKIREVKRLKERNTFIYLKNRADELKAERRYEEALEFYKRAQEQKQDANLNGTEIAALRSILLVVKPPKSLLESKQYAQAVAECVKVKKEHKKDLANYPELYFITAKADEGLFLNNPENPGAKDGEPRNSNLRDALKNYTLAITAFPNYIDALIARANFYIRYIGDYAKAISDYELVLQDAADGNPEKPGYYATLAKWKDALGNSSDALQYYSKAIELNRRTDSSYFKKAELLYRLKRYDEAKSNFDIAIKLNPKYADAYYFRGLNFVGQNNYHLAGVDFTKLTTLLIKPAQKTVIDSISASYFANGETEYKKHSFKTAEQSYNNALEINKCNADALHGIANIYLSQAKELTNIAEVNASIKKSILYNKDAIACNPNFSDAYYRKGLAEVLIKQYDDAIASFSEAIKSNTANTDAIIERGNTYQVLSTHAKAVDDYINAMTLLTASLELAKKNNEKALAVDITNELSKINQLCGTSKYILTDYAFSMQYLNKALDYNQQNAEAFYYRGLVNEAQNELSKSIKDYNEALKINQDYRYFYANGKANFKKRVYDQSIANFSNAIIKDSAGTVKDRYYLRGISYFKNKEYDKAASDYALYEKYEGSKSDSTFWVDYGFAKLYLKDDTQAASYFTQALSLNANNAKALYGMGCTYVRAGNFDKGLELISKSFSSTQIKKEDIKLFEEDLLAILSQKENKPNRNKYNQLKKTLLQ